MGVKNPLATPAPGDWQPRNYTVKRVVRTPEKNFYKIVGTLSMDPKGKSGKLFLNMFDEEYLVYPAPGSEDE